MVKLLMFGRIKYDLRKFLFDKDVGLLRSKEMAAIREEDARALALHLSKDSWEVADVQKSASRKLTEFRS